MARRDNKTIEQQPEKKRGSRTRKVDLNNVNVEAAALEEKTKTEEPVLTTRDDKDTYTKEENKAALLAQIEEIEAAYLQGQITFKDKSAQISAIRFRLQDKFELEKSDKEKRIIVVPAKHLFICPHTNRECSNMPPKEVCMKYYNLVEKKKT